MPPVLSMSPSPLSQIESTRNSIDVYRLQIDRKRLNPYYKGHGGEQGNHGHIVSRLLKAFGSPLCALGVVIKTLDTLIDLIDTQPHLVRQLIENDICLLLVSWLGQTKRNSSCAIPVKILKCISQFLAYASDNDEEIFQLFVDGFLLENLGLIFDIFKEDNYILLYTGRILRSLADAKHICLEQPSASRFLESILMTLLSNNLGATVLFDFCYGIKGWNRNQLCRKTEPIIKKIVKKVLTNQDNLRPKTIRQFLTLVIVSHYPTFGGDNCQDRDATEALYLSQFKWADKRKEMNSLLDATLQCFVDHSAAKIYSPRLLRTACAALCVLLHQYYHSRDPDDHSILLYSLKSAVCEAMIRVLSPPSSREPAPLKLTMAVLQVFVLLFSRGCLFRKQLLRSDFIRITHDASFLSKAPDSGCGCGGLSPTGIRIVTETYPDADLDKATSPSHHLLQKWLPLLAAAQNRCQQIRQSHFRQFLQRSTFTPSSRRLNFSSFSVVFSQLYPSRREEKLAARLATPLEDVFRSQPICAQIALFL